MRYQETKIYLSHHIRGVAAGLAGPCDHSDGELFCFFDKYKEIEQNISGKRVAFFGLHDFKPEKILEYEKTGKSDYFVVPIIGESSAIFIGPRYTWGPIYGSECL